MKYMHFKASCSYAALAEMMETRGIQTQDDQIALDMKLPYLFAKEEDTYLAGPMLQGAFWFDLWLNPRGFFMKETRVERENLARYLQEHQPVMLGIHLPRGNENKNENKNENRNGMGKHAVVLKEYCGGTYRFFNPTHEGDPESAELIFHERELLEATEQTIVAGCICEMAPVSRDLAPFLLNSITVLRENCVEIQHFAAQRHAKEEYSAALNRLFRPLFLDGITMLELIGEKALAQEFGKLQRDFLSFLKGPCGEEMEKAVSMERLRDLTGRYVSLIEAQNAP